MTEEGKQRILKWSVIACRIIIGAIFVISGIAKDIDLWGTLYKIEEYLNVWHFSQPRTIVFMASFLLSGTEFILGALLLLGCLRRAVPILMLGIMAFMLPLTLYIYISNPVTDCGCFGDFITLSNAATFWKNVLITAALIFLLLNNRKVAPLFSPYIQWLVVTLLAAYAIIIGLYGYNIQPMIDFRSFPVGASLIPSDDVEEDNADSSSLSFVYEKEGLKQTFTLDNLPDSTWTFVDRIDLSDKGGDRTELVVYDLDGNEATSEAISDQGEEIILVIPQLARAEVSWTYFLNELSEYMDSHGGTMAAFIAGDESAVESWMDLSMASYPVYTAESTTLKELARGNMALVYLRDGKVVWKRSMAMMDTSMTDALIITEDWPDLLADNGPDYFKALSFILIAALMALYLLDSTGRLLRWRIRRRKARRKSDE